MRHWIRALWSIALSLELFYFVEANNCLQRKGHCVL